MSLEIGTKKRLMATKIGTKINEIECVKLGVKQESVIQNQSLQTWRPFKEI